MPRFPTPMQRRYTPAATDQPVLLKKAQELNLFPRPLRAAAFAREPDAENTGRHRSGGARALEEIGTCAGGGALGAAIDRLGQAVEVFSRLSRYDETGLIWLLQGRPVVALTEATAAIQSSTGALTICAGTTSPRSAQ